MTIVNTTASKLVVAFVAVAMVFSMSLPARAQSTADLQAQINALLAQISSLQAQLGGGGSSSSSSVCPYTWTRDLTLNSTGGDVMKLQQWLMDGGQSIPAGPTEFFGGQTQAALASYQAANGISPAVGYFGPISRANINPKCASAPVAPPADDGGDLGDSGDTGNGGPLSGGAGSLDDTDYVSKLSNEEVGEDEADVPVAGLIIESEGSDIELRAANLNFSQGSGASSDFDKYAADVSIWFEGEEIARLDADEFTDDDNFDKTVSFDSGAIIREDQTGELIVAVSGINNLDSTDATDKWTLEFENVRFADAQGGIITDTSTGDINDGSGRTFSFETFATAADTEFKVTASNDDINDTRVIVVDDTNDTDNETLFAFEVEVEGTSDIDIDDVPVDFISTGAGVGEIINTAELWVEGVLIDSETVASSTDTTVTVTFDNIDWQITAGDKVSVVIKVDVNDTDGAFGEGDTLAADVNPDDSGWDIEDDNSDDLVAADKTGTASNDAHLFYTIAPGVKVVSSSIVSNDNGNAPAETATAKIELEITALGGTLYINGDDESTENKHFFVGQVYGSGITASSTASTTTFTVIGGTNDVTNSGADNEYYTLDEGESMTIRVESIVNQTTVTTTAVLAGLKASAIKFGTATTSDTTRSASSLTYTDLLDATQSGTASLVNAS